MPYIVRKFLKKYYTFMHAQLDVMRLRNQHFVDRFLSTLHGFDNARFMQAYEQKLSTMQDPTIRRGLDTLAALPPAPEDMTYSFDTSRVSVSSASFHHSEELTALLKGLNPWRKGPFQLFDVHVDAEWRSDWKWDRMASVIGTLKDRKVLDVGCNSGYYMYRMLAHDPKWVLGVDPSARFYMQFEALQHYFLQDRAAYFPVKIEQIWDCAQACFDVIFYLGILYHQPDPKGALQAMHRLLDHDGRLLLDTLIWPGEGDHVVEPEDTYAMMKNVYHLPTQSVLLSWIKEAGFSCAEVVSVDPTSLEEQRQSEWMTTYSLAQFLDPNDRSKTVEGYPAPTRIIIHACA